MPFSRAHSDSSSISSSDLSDSRGHQTSWLRSSMVVRLFFATAITFSEDNNNKKKKNKKKSGSSSSSSLRIFTLQARNDRPRSRHASDNSVEVSVIPGHIVMSDFLRQQLGIRLCSTVQVLEVRDEWKVPLGKQALNLHLSPLTSVPDENFFLVQLSFKDWVSKTEKYSLYGLPLVEGSIIPLALEGSQKWRYFRVGTSVAPDLMSPPPPLPPSLRSGRVTYALVTARDIHDQPQRVNLCEAGAMIPGEGGVSRARRRGDDLSGILPDLKEIDPPTFTECLEHFGAMDHLYSEGVLYIQSCFAGPNVSGALLICGIGGGEGGGGGAGRCGKTSLARLLCKEACDVPYCAYVSVMDCIELRGQRSAIVSRRLREKFHEAICYQPSIVFLDNLDSIAPFIADIQQDASGEGPMSSKRCQILLDLMNEVKEMGAKVVIMATAHSRQQLHRNLLHSKGDHVFEKVIEIVPPSLAERKAILKAMLSARDARNRLSEADFRSIAEMTEGYLAGDLLTLLEVALRHSELQATYQTHVQEQEEIPVIIRQRAFTNSTEDGGDFEWSGVVIPYTAADDPELVVSMETEKETPFSNSATPVLNRKSYLSRFAAANSALASYSGSSLVRQGSEVDLQCGDGEQELVDSVIDSIETPYLSLEDFRHALEGFVPASLKGLPLHLMGSVTFQSIGGMKNAKKTLKETLFWPSKYPSLFKQCPIKQRCGVLLYGPPGTGKTLIAGAVAKEFRLNFVSIKGPELLSKYIGSSEAAVRDLFTRAQTAKPCILFFDEFESLAPKRGHDRTGVTDRVVNQLLTQLDGVEAIQGVFVLAATSRPDLIDKALLRSGRIDRSLLCDIPTEEERLDILKVLTSNLPLAPDVDLKQLSGPLTEGLTGADLKALLYNAQLQAAHAALDGGGGEGGRGGEGGGGGGGGGGGERERETRKEKGFSQHKSSGGLHDQASHLAVELMEFTSSGVRESKVVSNQKATALRERGQDLEKKELIFPQLFKSHRQSITDRKPKLKVEIKQQYLVESLESLQPSVSSKELKKYRQIYAEFLGERKTTLADVTEQRATMA